MQIQGLHSSRSTVTAEDYQTHINDSEVCKRRWMLAHSIAEGIVKREEETILAQAFKGYAPPPVPNSYWEADNGTEVDAEIVEDETLFNDVLKAFYNVNDGGLVLDGAERDARKRD